MIKSKFSDNHAHFTGSLPLEFVWKNLRRRKLPLQGRDEETWKRIFKNLDYTSCLAADDGNSKRYFAEFKSSLALMYGEDAATNLDLFFRTYRLFQYWTKSDDLKEMSDLYYEGTIAISDDFYEDKVANFEIIAGPMAEWNVTKTRFDNMVSALEKQDDKNNLKSFGQIRITFIRNSSRQYSNYSPELLKLILQEIDKNRAWEKRISGFDFSGVEVTNEFSIQNEILSKLKKYNNRRQKESKKRFLISCHAGEDFVNNRPEDLNNFFEELLKNEVDRICHGTYLWAPTKYLDISKTENKKRELLLFRIAERNIELEICPTANLLLSPIKSYSDIPIKKLDNLGAKYSINTDNKTLFSTNLAKEYDSINCYVA